MGAASFPDTITTAQLCELLALPKRTLMNWKSAGLIKPTARGHWPTVETLRSIFNHLRTQSVPADGRAALTREQTRLKRLAADELERKLISRLECEDGWIRLAGLFVSALESAPSRLAGAVAGAQDPAEVRGLLKREIHSIRNQLADELDAICRSARGETR